jgi:hypothetical protein
MSPIDEVNPRPRMQIPASIPLGVFVMLLVEGFKAFARGE